MLAKIVFISALMALSGCVTPQYVWHKDGASQQEFYMDQGFCKAQGIQGTGGMINMGTFMIINSCMQGKGWEEQEVRSTKIIPIKPPTN